MIGKEDCDELRKLEDPIWRMTEEDWREFKKRGLGRVQNPAKCGAHECLFALLCELQQFTF